MLQLHKQASIITEDTNGIIAVNKPISVKSMPNNHLIDQQALIISPYDHKQEAYILPDGKPLFLLNRLDSPTSGIVLLCREQTVANQVRALFKKKQIKKIYTALTHFQKIPTSGIWNTYISKQHIHNKRNNAQYIRSHIGRDMQASTQYKVIRNLFLHHFHLQQLHLYPLTGRTHQLRVQCAQHKLPILGDKTYGNFQWNKQVFLSNQHIQQRMYLHAEHIEFTYTLAHKQYHFSAYADSNFDTIGK